MKTSPEIFEAAMTAYRNLDALRRKRGRMVDFAFGRQWGDIAYDPNTEQNMSENLIARAQGVAPVTVNVLRRIVRTLVGKFRADSAQKYSAENFATVAGLNSLPELDARLLEEFIISGCAIQRVTAERRPQGSGIWVDNINPNIFFVNRFEDPRGGDIDLVGAVHDLSWPCFANRFIGADKMRRRRLRPLFERLVGKTVADAVREFPSAPASIFDDPFPSATPPDKIRLLEVWSYEPEATCAGTAYKMLWRVRWFAADGTLLSCAKSHLPHAAHPFVVKFYPLVDGCVYPFIEDLVDRQKALNRLMSSFEASMATAAKGVLLFPVDRLTGGLTMDDISKLWARHDTVIPVSNRTSELPSQLYANPSLASMVPLIELQLKLLDEASGVGSSAFGRSLSSSIGAEACKAILANAEASVADLFASFRAFLAERDAKISRSLPPSS